MRGARPSVLGAGLGAFALASLAVSVWAFGGPRAFFSHPARSGLVAVNVAAVIAAAFSGMSLGGGSQRASDGIFLPMIPLTIGVIWLVPYLDHRDVLALDGDVVRYLGLALVVVGDALRVWPMYSLGWRFSPVLAIQEGHRLETRGLYRVVRHPSYLGGVVGTLGWMLVFRSVVGLALMLPLTSLMLRRIDVEERLLGEKFGAEWTAYRSRSWRLIPYVY